METDPLALQNQVCFSLAVAARTVIGLYRPVLEPLGLTHPQYLVMLALWERSPRSLADLGSSFIGHFIFSLMTVPSSCFLSTIQEKVYAAPSGILE